MTETILLQLLADIRLILRNAAKPVTHVTIADALATTVSAAHTRVLLRVLDVMVQAGEVLRDINVDGGLCTYLARPEGPNAHTGKRLLKAFEFDLEEAAAAGDAITTAETTAPPKAAPPAPARPTMPNVTQIKPGAKPEPYRPADPVRARVLGLIDEARQCSRAFLVSRLHDVKVHNVDQALWALSKSGLIVKLGPGEYSRPEGVTAAAAGTSVAPKKAAPPKPAAKVRAVKDSLTAAQPAPPATPAAPVFAGPACGLEAKPFITQAQAVFAGPITTLDGIVTDSPARDLAQPLATGMLRVMEALQDFGATLRDHANTVPAKPAIADLDTKVAVLRKLAPMVAADISAVLDAVANDLQAVAA